MNLLRTAGLAIGMCVLSPQSWANAVAGAGQEAIRSTKIAVTIETQKLSSALNQWAEQTGMMVMVPVDGAAALMAPRVEGNYTPEQALVKLLGKTGLTYEFVGPRTVAIHAVRAAANGAFEERSEARASLANRLAQVPAASISTNSATSPAEGEGGTLAEIIVTAQKREERLQDVPVPVTAISALALVDNNQPRLQDFYTSVPGLNLTLGPRGESQFAIRGVATGAGNPTVGIVIDDVPYGTSTALANGAIAPDIDPSDLARIEVLRGPQGTLYGASSMGGLLKYVTVDPSTEKVSGRIQAGTNWTRNASEPGFGLRGAINIPVSGDLAVRLSGFTRLDPGYIDNVETGEDGVNSERVYGGRLSTLWRPSQDLSLKFSALFQDDDRRGSPEADLIPGLKDLQQSRLRGTGGYDRKVQAYSATLKAKIGDIDLVALSGYSVNKVHDSIDYTAVLGAATEGQFGVTGSPEFEYYRTAKFTQELRLSGTAGPRIDWLLGAFYNHEDSSPQLGSLLAEDPVTGAVAGRWFDNSYPSTYKEYALFTDLTFHITDRFDLQVGGREGQNRQSYSQISVGPYNAVSPFIVPEVHSKDNSFTYLVTPQFKVLPDVMVYARLASGYRAGGPNFGGATVPPTFGPDKTQNYELGLKGSFLEDTLSFDASIYRIDWRDIQIYVYDSQFAFFYANAGNAKSQGIELSVESKPLTGLTLSAWGSWNDAKLTDNLPSASASIGSSGDRLPFSARFSASFSAQQDIPISTDVTGFMGASISYLGSREGNFASAFAVPPQRQHYPAYTKTDLRVGARYDSWSVNLFVNNLTDKRGLLLAGFDSGTGPSAVTFVEPRNAGLSFAKDF